jgi:hypothetical protein
MKDYTNKLIQVQSSIQPTPHQIYFLSVYCYTLYKTDKVLKLSMRLTIKNSAPADGGPRSRVCARETLRLGGFV